MCDSGCNNGCANGCGQPTKIITEQGIQGETGATGATGPQGDPGADGSDGLGYDNMQSTTAINITAAVPFSNANTIDVDKAVTVGTRLRYTSQGDLTQWIEGVVTSYVVGTGNLNIDFDLKSSTGTGVHSDWAVTVIGEPGSVLGFDTITNVGTGEDVFKGINGTDAEFKRILGDGAVSGGITTVGDDVVVNPLTDDEIVEVWPNGTMITPSFSYVAAIGESLTSSGSIGASSKVWYIDWNEFIYLIFDVRIENFQLNHASNQWSIHSPTLQINGLPTLTASGGEPELFSASMSAHTVESPTSAPDFVMECHRPVRMVYNSGNIGLKNDGYSTKVPVRNENININYYGQILIRKN